MFNINSLFLSLILFSAFSLNAEAKLYKWVDDNGVTHYGEVIPPEYANKDKDLLNKSGRIVKRAEKPTAEELQAKEEAEEKRKVVNQAMEEHKRRDNALLNTYSNEKEIDQARDRSLELINARIDSNKILLKSSQNSLDEDKAEADKLSKQGKKIPQSLANDIALTESRVLRLQTELNKNEEELSAVKTRFEKDKEMFRRIKADNAKK